MAAIVRFLLSTIIGGLAGAAVSLLVIWLTHPDANQLSLVVGSFTLLGLVAGGFVGLQKPGREI
jgi:uncharacterized membrane protein YccC